MAIWSTFIKKLVPAKKCVSVLRLKGTISPGLGGFAKSSSLSLESMRKDVDRAFSVRGLKAVVLVINSPGGAPVQAELIRDYIRRKSKDKKIPVYSFVEDVAASGGYWLACASDEIYASENSIIGSIGVIAAGFGFTDAIKKLGIERRIIAQGNNKSIYDPFMPVKEGGKKLISAVQKDIYESFKKLVTSSRGKRLAKNKDKLFSGAFWSGKESVALGLVDGLGNFYDVMEKKYGKGLQYEFIEHKPGWLGEKFKWFGIGSSDPLNDIVVRIKEQLELEKFQV